MADNTKNKAIHAKSKGKKKSSPESKMTEKWNSYKKSPDYEKDKGKAY